MGNVTVVAAAHVWTTGKTSSGTVTPLFILGAANDTFS